MKSKDGLRVHGFKRMYNDIYFTRIKKHYCPECGERLGLIACSKVVNRKSEEARNFNFSIGDSYMIGNIKFTWDEFICPKCERQFIVKELKRIEKGLPPQESESEKLRNKKVQVLLSILFIILAVLFLFLVQHTGQKNTTQEVTQTEGKITMPYMNPTTWPHKKG